MATQQKKKTTVETVMTPISREKMKQHSNVHLCII